MPRGPENVTVVPQAATDPLRGGGGTAADPYPLEGCHVLPRIGSETGGGVIGVGGFDVYYYGSAPAPDHDARVVVRGETHEIEGEPRDFRPLKRVVIFTTKKVGT